MYNTENEKLKSEITKCQKTLSKASYINDPQLKGGFRVQITNN